MEKTVTSLLNVIFREVISFHWRPFLSFFLNFSTSVKKNRLWHISSLKMNHYIYHRAFILHPSWGYFTELSGSGGKGKHKYEGQTPSERFTALGEHWLIHPHAPTITAAAASWKPSASLVWHVSTSEKRGTMKIELCSPRGKEGDNRHGQRHPVIFHLSWRNWSSLLLNVSLAYVVVRIHLFFWFKRFKLNVNAMEKNSSGSLNLPDPLFCIMFSVSFIEND